MATIKITVCPSCGSSKIKTVRRDWTASFKGKQYTVPNLRYCECPECGETVYDREAMREIEAHSPGYERLRPTRKSA